MLRRLFLAFGIIGGFLGAPVALAQSNDPERIYAMGAETPSADEVENYPTVSLTRAYIPEAISLVDRFPLPGNQGETHSCVAWATAYAARSYYNALLANSTGRPQGAEIASPAYLHNLMYWGVVQQATGKQCHQVGSLIPLAMDYLTTHGALSHQDYDFSNVCVASANPDAGRAARNKISGTRKIAWAPRQLLPGEAGRVIPVNLDKVRQQLAAGHPVVFGMEVGRIFMNLRPGTVYTNIMSEADDPKKGLHAMVVVGYDDRRQAFYVINSWGRDWAEGGFGWISYKSFLADVTNAWTMDVAGVRPPPPAPTRPPEIVSVLPPQIASLSCADIRTERTGGPGMRYTGFVGTPEGLRKVEAQALGEGGESAVTLRPWPVCETMLTLKDPLHAASKPAVEVQGGKSVSSGSTALKVGETFSIKITAPDVPSFLYAFYIEDDGTVVNLIPRRGPIRKQTMAGEQVVIGDGQQGRATFRVTPLKSTLPAGDAMRGHEAVVVIAARAPVQELEDQEKPDSPIYRVAAKAGTEGPPDRLLLSLLRDITQQRAGPNMLPREVSAGVVHIRIEE